MRNSDCMNGRCTKPTCSTSSTPIPAKTDGLEVQPMLRTGAVERPAGQQVEDLEEGHRGDGEGLGLGESPVTRPRPRPATASRNSTIAIAAISAPT